MREYQVFLFSAHKEQTADNEEIFTEFGQKASLIRITDFTFNVFCEACLTLQSYQVITIQLNYVNETHEIVCKRQKIFLTP